MCKEIERSVRLIRRYLPAVCAAAMDAGAVEAVEAVIKSISAIVEQNAGVNWSWPHRFAG